MARIARRSWLVMALVSGFAGSALAQAPAKTPATKAAPKAQDDLAYLPADAELVMGVHFANMQQSDLWKQLVEPQLMKGDVKVKLDEFKAICGMDPLKTVQSFTFGLKNLKDGKPEGIAVGNGVDRAVVMGCMDKLSKDAKTKAKITRDGDNYMIKGDDGSNVAVQLVGDRMIMQLGPKASIAGVKAAAKGGSRLKAAAHFAPLYKKIKTNETAWLLIHDKSKLFDDMGTAMGAKPKAIYGSFNVTRDLSADVHIRVPTAKDATTMATNVKSQAQGLSAFVDKIDVSSAGSDVSISIMISNAKLQTLIKMAGGGGSTQAPPPPPPPPPGGGGLGAPTKKK